MLSDPPQSANSLSPPPGTEPRRAKVRLRFRKDGDLRLVSHHDLMTCFERMLRRAGLPFHSTEGYHPKPRLVFALSLALGVVGADEVADLELDAELPPEEIHARLAAQAPPGLEIRSVQTIDRRAKAHVVSVTYRVNLTPPTDLPARSASLLAATESWVERTRPQARRFNLRPYLRALRLLPAALEMDLWVTPTGAARPDEVLAALGLADVLAAGAVLERTRLELRDDNPTPGPAFGREGEAPAEPPSGSAGASPSRPAPLSFKSQSPG
jgi:radical SAM-linked protein